MAAPISASDLPDTTLRSERPYVAPDARRGRGAISRESGRYEPYARVALDDGWNGLDQEPAPLKTTVAADASRSVITRNQSPDVPFDRSINPYRGCEHGCIYCFARPTHAWLGLSPGLDFESRLFAKLDGPALLRKELARPGYRPSTIAFGTNTDPYQPIERQYKIMRGMLEVLAEAKHPLSIVTKSHLITRDIDILSTLAKMNLVKVYISVTTLDAHVARTMEPRAATPTRRLQTMRDLNAAGIPTGVMVAPIIPALNDHEMEGILSACYDVGARSAGYVLIRLPIEVKTLFKEWLVENYPDRAERIMSRIRAMRHGADNDSTFGRRMRGEGVEADLLALRFRQAAKRLGFNREHRPMTTSLFQPPERDLRQLRLL